MKLFEVEALVINKIDIGESDRLFTLFEKKSGKIKVLIKGIRKSTKREIYATDPLVLGEYKLRKKGERVTVESLSIINPYLGIKNSFFKLELALYLIKLIEKITFENSPADKIYDLTINALNYIEKTEDKNKIFVMISYYFYKLCKIEGLCPKIEGKNYFNFDKGKIENLKSNNSAILEKKQFEYIEKLNNVDIDGINKLKFSNNEILAIIGILEEYLNYNLELKLNINIYFWEEK